jgi:hypothetical protein
MRVGRKQVGILHKFKSIKCCESQILKGQPDFELTVRLTFSIIKLLSGFGRSYFVKDIWRGNQSDICESQVASVSFWGYNEINP